MRIPWNRISPARRQALLWVAAAVVVINALVGFTVYSAVTEGEDDRTALQRMRIMMQVLQLVRQNYVDPEETAPSRLLDHALEGMVNSLDPFSSYLKPDEYENMMESTEGEFGGLGVVVTIRDGVLTVVSPMEGSPGAEAGLKAGDRIVEIEGTSTREMGLSEAVKLLKGDPGTEVSIRIFRPKTQKTMEKTVTRQMIEVPSVKNVRILKEDIGYLRITQFSEATGEDLQKALRSLLDDDVAGIVVDVRNNPGGLLNSAVNACSLFLPKGKLIVSTEGRADEGRRSYRTTNGSVVPKALPVVVLVNGGTASAAEILAGCLQDWGRAVLIGEQTFGKGSVQNIIPLPDQSALRLTTAKYYTPSRRVIHERGIAPDIVVELSEEDERQIMRKRRAGKEDVVLDSQIQRALDTLTSYRTFRQASRGNLSVK